MLISFDHLIALHEKLWGDTDLQQQINKYAEELNEFDKSTSGTQEELFEIADLVIVSAGIARFNYTKGLEYLNDTFGCLKVTKFSMQELWEAVATKMKKNESRKWEKTSDTGYHHIDIYKDLR